MNRPTIRILVVDDFEQWRKFVISAVGRRPEWQVVGEAADGSEALQKAKKLDPDLMLMDIGLPTFNGIEVARRIYHGGNGPKILFLTEHLSCEIAQEALRTGALGYIVKSDAARDLLPAVEAALQGRVFVSSRVDGRVEELPTTAL
jgi:DNA-binding NarL/FixJ family response regulator